MKSVVNNPTQAGPRCPVLPNHLPPFVLSLWFDKLRTNGIIAAPIMVSLSNHSLTMIGIIIPFNLIDPFTLSRELAERSKGLRRLPLILRQAQDERKGRGYEAGGGNGRNWVKSARQALAALL